MSPELIQHALCALCAALLAVLAALVAGDLVVLLGGSVVGKRGPSALLLNLEFAELDADVAHLSPVLTP